MDFDAADLTVFTADVVDVAVFTASFVTFRLTMPARPPLKNPVGEGALPPPEELPELR